MSQLRNGRYYACSLWILCGLHSTLFQWPPGYSSLISKTPCADAPVLVNQSTALVRNYRKTSAKPKAPHSPIVTREIITVLQHPRREGRACVCCSPSPAPPCQESLPNPPQQQVPCLLQCTHAPLPSGAGWLAGVLDHLQTVRFLRYHAQPSALSHRAAVLLRTPGQTRVS